MGHTPLEAGAAADPFDHAERRWSVVLEGRPDLAPAIALQRRLLTLVADLGHALEHGRLPRLSLPSRYLAAKLARGVPVLAGEPIPIPVPVLQPALARLCEALAEGGAGETATRIKKAIQTGEIEIGSLLKACLTRNQTAIRAGATHRGLAPDLVWLVAELTVSPFVHILQSTLLGRPADEPLRSVLDGWNWGYCLACGSWPALAEVVGGHRTLRCAFCAAAWELTTYACIYCQESGEQFVTAAPNEERKDRRVEVCRACGSYLKTIDLPELSPFPLLAISDLETTDLDVAAMEHGYTRPVLKDFSKPAVSSDRRALT
jgi:FdhE protein